MDKEVRNAKIFTAFFLIMGGISIFPLLTPRGFDFLFLSQILGFLMIYGFCAQFLAARAVCPNMVAVGGKTLLFTALGMVIRFFVEYGEVSNRVNFTPVNILVYLLASTMYVCISSYVLSKKYDKPDA